VGRLALLAVLVAMTANCVVGGFSVSVDQWRVGSADVSGTITNNTSSGCTDPEVTLKFYDHNQARVQEWIFGAGDTAEGQTRKWRTHMFFITDEPVEPSVVSVTADATCADQR
jgi:hypothetical protein